MPASLEVWLDLNHQADAAEKAEDMVTFENLYPEIEEAWESAPFLDRLRVSWDLFPKPWRERSNA